MIVVKDLHTMDQIAIRTKNSEYHFQVIEPTQCRGLLSGGVFGEEQHEAILTGAIVEDHSQHRISSNLEIGTSALFYIAIKERMKCLTTSAITNLEIACHVM